MSDKPKIYKIRAKSLDFIVEAKTKTDAIRKFFELIIKDDELDNIGQVAVIKGKTESEDTPFRTTPALFYLGLLTREELVKNLERMVGCKISDEEIDEMVEKDKRFVKDIKTHYEDVEDKGIVETEDQIIFSGGMKVVLMLRKGMTNKEFRQYLINLTPKSTRADWLNQAKILRKFEEKHKHRVRYDDSDERIWFERD